MADPDYTNYYQIVNLHDLFAAPIIATVDADFMAAIKFVEYIRKYGFDRDKTLKKSIDEDVVNWGKLKMVAFTYSTPYLETNKKGKTVEKYIKHKIEVPALSLIPLPLLQVTEGDFDMNLRILGAVSKEPVPKLIAKDEEDGWDEIYPMDDLKKTEVKASLAPLNQREQSDELAPNLIANFKSKIKIRQADIPAGIAEILSITQEANSAISGKVDSKEEDIIR